MGAVKARQRPAPVRELFAVPAAPAAEPAAPVMTKDVAAVLALLDKLFAPTGPARDLAVALERIRNADGRQLVTRTRDANGHLYRAWERTDVFSYGVDLKLTWGRIDTRRPFGVQTDDLRAAIDYQMACEAEARALINLLCPETALAKGETAVSCGIYDGPGYVLVTSDPATRLRIACGARRPA